MLRIRKRSGTKTSTGPPHTLLQSPSDNDTYDFFPALPPTGDFRTSLILPDLSRRFSLLRSPAGDAVTVEDLKTRFAEQRARGAENQISEEEEDMLLETLGRMRSRTSVTPDRSSENVTDGEGTPNGQQSARHISSGSLTSSLTTSTSVRANKRYSNNLFGSGRLRDYQQFVKSGASTKSNNSTRTVSLTPTEASETTRGGYTSSVDDSLRPSTPDGGITSSSFSVQSSPNDKGSIRSAVMVPPAPYGEQVMSVAEHRLGKTIGLSKRASLALEEVIKEIEDEAEDEIVMPRSAPVPRGSFDQPSQLTVHRDSETSRSSSIFEAGTAISSDKQVSNVIDESRASPVPSRILPGYIPGMPRPMTPRDFDLLDDQRSHSTTPRATSPVISAIMDATAARSSSPATTLHRRESSTTSTNSRYGARPTTPVTAPLFLQRSPNGRQTPEAETIEFDSPTNSTLLTRRRPVSPLSSPPYQPISATVGTSSRPSTPSNVIWTTSKANTDDNTTPQKQGQWMPSHNSNGSFIGDVGSSDINGISDRSRFGIIPPQTPDSPTFDRRGIGNSNGAFGDGNGSKERGFNTAQGSSGTPTSRFPRSPTPTQSATRSPVSPIFSDVSLRAGGTKRSSRQNTTPSPFNFGAYSNPLGMSLGMTSGAHSSRSSLESTGSSFHSWDAERERDLTGRLFGDSDVQQPVWHDFSSDKSSATSNTGACISVGDGIGEESAGSGAGDEWDADEIVKRYTGLTIGDFKTIQEKLVSVALVKATNPEFRERAPSSMRKRRPSTSQSNYSVRVASPPPQTQPPASPITPTASATASDLLKSVVDSIQTTPNPLNTLNVPHSPTEKEASPTTRRNRDLAQVLFGRQEEQRQEELLKAKIEQNSEVRDTPRNDNTTTTQPPVLPSSTSQKPYQLTRNPSTSRVPLSPRDESELVQEVQQRTEAAMLALKGSNSKTNLSDGLTRSSSRRRVDTSQISTPKLVSASTSVDAMPLRSPSLSAKSGAGGPSKIGSRFKKLLTKNITPIEEDSAQISVQTRLNTAGSQQSQTGTLDMTRSRMTDSPIPPATSSASSLKGFMARFRSKQRIPESSPTATDHRKSPISTSSVSSSAFSQSGHVQGQGNGSAPKVDKIADPITTWQSETVGRQSPAPQSNTLQFNTPSAPTLHVQAHSQVQSHVEGVGVPVASPVEDTNESTALKQLFDAATNLGLDQSALSDLLARSGSTSSRSNNWTLLTRSNSAATAQQPGTPTQQPKPMKRIDSDDTATQSIAHGVDNQMNIPTQEKNEDPISRIATQRKAGEGTRRLREGLSDNATNPVVRRTLIFPSEFKAAGSDANSTVTRKNSRRRRASATSMSTRSVHDRAPTPPPPKSPTARRFSNDGSPPVPHLPRTRGQTDQHLGTPTASTAGGPIEKSSSTYDSLYEMYAGESRAASSAGFDPNAVPDAVQQHARGEQGNNAESGPALELIELANGETIWQIVNGLRDEEEDFNYGNRASFASEYSMRETRNDGVQIFVRDHARSGSKGSTSSLLSRRKQNQGKSRPETQVYYTPSAQIGRMIESLSQGMDAGSFNFNIVPNRGLGHSASSSMSTNDMNWTVEERLDHMIGSINHS